VPDESGNYKNKEKNLSLIVQPSYEAIASLNELAEQGKKVAALIHITC